jgi:hypothetical protein
MISSNPTVEELFFCGSEGLFTFDFILVAIFMIALVGIMCYKFRIPPIFSLFSGLTIIYSLSLIAGAYNPIMNSFIILCFLGIGAYVAFAIFDYFKNYTR